MKFRYLLVFLIILPLLLIFKNAQVHQTVHRFSLTLLKPVILAGDSVAYGLSSIKETTLRFWNMFQNSEIYEQQVRELEAKLTHFTEIENENKRLQELLDFKKSIPEKSLGARVIGWDLSVIKKTVILDKGSSQGVNNGMAVVAPRGLVGRVLEDGPNTSRAILLTDPDSRVSGISQDSRTHGIVMGDGTPYLTLRYLDLDSGIAVGETILSSGVGGIFPKGIGIGKVESLERDPSGFHLSAKVIPFVAFSKLEEVLCVDYLPPKS